MDLSLKKARLINEKSQQNMADMLKMHVDTYRKLESDPDLVTIKQAKKIAQYLEIPYDSIFFGK